MKLCKRYTEGDDFRQAVFWWAHYPGQWWGVGVCLPLPRIYWSWRARYRVRFKRRKWTASIRTFPRRL